MDKYKQGEDIQKDIDLFDSEGLAIPLAALADYGIKVYSVDDSKTLMLDYAKTPSGDQKPIEVLDTDGKLRIRADRAWSAAAEPSTYMADVYLYFVDADGLDGKTLEIIESVEIFRIEL